MRKISLSQIEAFVWICRLGTFRAAADHLNLTQPSVSQRIRELEEALSTRLFERRGTGARLTAQGGVVLRYAEQGLALFDELQERVRTGDPLQGKLRLGVSDSVAMTWLPEMLRDLETNYQRLQVELNVNNSHVLWTQLTHRELDLAFLTDAGQHRGVEVVPIGRTEVSWLSSAAKRIVTGTSLHPRDLAGITLLSMPPPSPLNDILVQWYTYDGLPPPSVNPCNNISLIVRLLCAGIGAAVLPVCTVRQEIEAGALVRYASTPELPPRILSAAFPAGSRGAGIDLLLACAKRAISKTASFEIL